MITIELPFPPKELSPNARGSWRKKEKARVSYKDACYKLTKSWLNKNIGKYVYLTEGKLPLNVMFHVPDRRGYDADNLNARMKYGYDGIAEALAVNDKFFRPVTYDMTDEPFKGGKVIVTIETIAGVGK